MLTRPGTGPGQVNDGGTTEGPPPDSGVDSNTPDGGEVDPGPPDSGTPDAGLPDSSPPDSGTPGGGVTYVHEWSVSPTGSDSASGTADHPFRTISRAIRAAGPGDRISVQPGTYAEELQITSATAASGTADQPILLQGVGMPKIVPGSSDWAMIVISRPHWTMDGFEVDGQDQLKLGIALKGDLAGTVVSHCDIHRSDHAGIETFDGADGATISGNEIHDIWIAPGTDAHGIAVEPYSTNITIRDNRIHDCSGDSIQCEAYVDSTPSSQQPDGILIENNKLYSSYEQGVDIKDCHHVTLRGNEMWDFPDAALIYHNSASHGLVEDNDLHDCGVAIGVGGLVDGPSPDDIVIRRNRIHDLAQRGRGTFDGDGFYLSNSTSVKVYNNTVTRITGAGFILGMNWDGGPTSDALIENNLVDAPIAVQRGGSAPGLVMDYNLFRSGASFQSGGTLDLSGWRDLGFGLHSLQATIVLNPDTWIPGANAVDHGVDVGLSFCGAAPDIGAVETGC